MNILITGKDGIAQGIANAYVDHNITFASRSTGMDIQNIHIWGELFLQFDMVFNCAYHNWDQVKVLEFFANNWQKQSNKTIVNIGSKLVDHARIERSIDRNYFPYRIHKQALQNAVTTISDNCDCRIVLINPGAVDTDLIRHLDNVNKMDLDYLGKQIRNILSVPEIRRVDLWQ